MKDPMTRTARQLLCLLPALVAGLLGGCRNYYLEGSPRALAAYNAFGEKTATCALINRRHADPLTDPTAAPESGGLGFRLGGRGESVVIEGVDGRADSFFTRLGTAGLTASLRPGDWALSLGLDRPLSYDFHLGENDELAVEGSLWRLGAVVSYGGDLRLGLGAAALYGSRRYAQHPLGEEAVELADALSGWRTAGGVRLSVDDWRLGLTLQSAAALPVGPGLPWELELWTAIPLTGFREERYALTLSCGARLWPARKGLSDARGMELDHLLADGIHGGLGADWTTQGGWRIHLGGHWGTYPVRTLDDATTLLVQQYAVGLDFGSGPRWSATAAYELIGGRPGDGFRNLRLDVELGLRLDW